MDFLETSYLNEVIPGGVGRCTPGNSWWGESSDSTNSHPLSDQKLSFSTPFSRPCRFVFRPGGSPRSQNTTYMSTYLAEILTVRLEGHQKDFLKPTSNLHITLSFLLAIPWWEMISDSRPEVGKVFTRFQIKTAQKPYPLGRYIYTYLCGLYKGALPRAVLTAEMMFIHMIRWYKHLPKMSTIKSVWVNASC